MTNGKSGIYLGITTTEKETGIAFVSEEKTLFELIEETDAHHNETIFTILDNAFKSLNLSPDELHGIGVVIGPGMFTSLRVGLACAKGLAVVNNIPIKGFNTLDALVFSLPDSVLNEKRTVIPTIDVRRNEVYYRIYQGLEPDSEPILAKPEVFAQKIIPDAIVLGSGLTRYVDIINANISVTYKTNDLKYPKPSSVAFKTAEYISRDDVSDLESLVPVYVR